MSACTVHDIDACTVCHDSTRPCPLCGQPMPVQDVRCALSRYVNRSICSPCGTVEALAWPSRIKDTGSRSCLYFDEIMGVALVAEDEAGYLPICTPPRDEHQWVRTYVEAVNHRHGIEREDQMAIVARSMGLGLAR
jgi:hypothetical protein